MLRRCLAQPPPVWFLGLVTGLLLGTSMLAAAPESQARTAPSYLRVSVLADETGAALPGVEVILREGADFESLGRVVDRVVTDGTDIYFRELVAGRYYEVEVSDPSGTYVDARPGRRQFGPVQDGYEIPMGVRLVKGSVLVGSLSFDGVSRSEPAWPMDVELAQVDGTVVRSVPAGSSEGWIWRFADVAPGRYLLRAVDPSGQRRTQYLPAGHVPAYSPARARIVEVVGRTALMDLGVIPTDTATRLYPVRPVAFDPTTLTEYGDAMRHSVVRLDPGEFEPTDVTQSIVWTYHGKVVAQDVTEFAVPALPRRSYSADTLKVTVTTQLSTGEPPEVTTLRALVGTPDMGCRITLSRPARLIPGTRLSVRYRDCVTSPSPSVRWSLDGRAVLGTGVGGVDLTLKRSWVGRKLSVFAHIDDPGYDQTALSTPIGRVVARRPGP